MKKLLFVLLSLLPFITKAQIGPVFDFADTSYTYYGLLSQDSLYKIKDHFPNSPSLFKLFTDKFITRSLDFSHVSSGSIPYIMWANDSGEIYKTSVSLLSLPQNQITGLVDSLLARFTKIQSDGRYLQSFTETDPLFNTKFAAKNTDGLTVGTTNLYFTNTLARAAISLTTIGTGAATYATGVMNIPTPPTFAPTVDTLSASRAFNTTYLMSSTKYVEIKISGSVSCSLSITGGTAGTIFLETSPDNVTWTSHGQLPASSTGTLTIGLNTVQISGGQLSTLLPPGIFWRARTSSTAGTATFTMFQGERITY